MIKPLETTRRNNDAVLRRACVEFIMEKAPHELTQHVDSYSTSELFEIAQELGIEEELAAPHAS